MPNKKAVMETARGTIELELFGLLHEDFRG